MRRVPGTSSSYRSSSSRASLPRRHCRRGLQVVDREGDGLRLLLRRVVVPVAALVGNRWHIPPQSAELRRRTRLPPMAQLVGHGMAELLLAHDPGRIEGQGITPTHVLPEPARFPSLEPDQPDRPDGPAEQRVECIGIRTRLDPSRDREHRGTVVGRGEGRPRRPLPRGEAVEPGGMSHHVEQYARRVGGEHAPFHPDQVDRTCAVAGDVRQIKRGGSPGATAARAHRSHQG